MGECVQERALGVLEREGGHGEKVQSRLGLLISGCCPPHPPSLRVGKANSPTASSRTPLCQLPGGGGWG